MQFAALKTYYEERDVGLENLFIYVVNVYVLFCRNVTHWIFLFIDVEVQL